MESSEWPNAMITAMAPIRGQMVPLNQPSDSVLNWRLRGSGAGGSLTLGASSRVMGHQIRKATTITVVICMMRRALPLDSWMPLMLLHQKYIVTATANTAANALGGACR